MSLELIRTLDDIAQLQRENIVPEMHWLTEPTSPSSPESSPDL
jgi:hypothetical protein